MPHGPRRRRVARALAAGVALQVLYVVFFVVPGHAPQPNRLPVAVVGSPAQGVVPQAQALDAQGLDLRLVPDERAARAAILDREVLGAIAGRRVLVASAASVPVAETIGALGREAGAREVVDVRPVDRDDPRGVTLNLFVLPLIVTGILVALVAGGLLPDLGLAGRAGFAACVALIGSLLTVLVVRDGVGALPGPYLALVGVTTLGVLGLALSAGGMVALVGQGGIALAFVVFLMLGSPASGLASAPELLPSPWSEAGAFLPPGAMGSALRGVAYFDGARVAEALLVLVAWCAIGLALHALAEGRRRSAQAG